MQIKIWKLKCNVRFHMSPCKFKDFSPDFTYFRHEGYYILINIKKILHQLKLLVFKWVSQCQIYQNNYRSSSRSSSSNVSCDLLFYQALRNLCTCAILTTHENMLIS